MSVRDVDGSIVVQFEQAHTVLREEEPGYLLGSMTILGTDFHVEAMRVDEKLGYGQEAWHPECDTGDLVHNGNDVRLEDLWTFSGSNFQTVQIPGFEGEYVLVITPYGK